MWYNTITRKCTTLWGRAWASSYYGNLHMNKLSFTLKWWADSLAFMSAVYARPLPEAISTQWCIICTVCEQPAVDGRSVLLWQTRSKVSCVLKFQSFPLRLPILHSGSSPALPFTYLLSARGRSIFEKYQYILTFTVYGRKQTSTLQTYFRNEVPLAQARPDYYQFQFTICLPSTWMLWKTRLSTWQYNIIIFSISVHDLPHIIIYSGNTTPIHR